MAYSESVRKDLISREDVLETFDELFPCSSARNERRFIKAVKKLPPEDPIEDMAVDGGYLKDWYISSVTDDSPVWTEEHIDELIHDFYLIPRPTGEEQE